MKKYILTLIPFILGIGCVVSYNTIGSKVASDGTLVEPFYLLPMGYLFLAIGIISLFVSKIKKVNK
ncbi:MULTISPECIES: DUF3955 domain-containing protein [unclassified Bacillus (in: firmicutes)]|uniref:DUF3955 domain-containing protein n=1 Tax=unclassified Bacillus (in: firmicutes) TaxID=185979 RepID=UPI0023DAA103|nr:MULTISPECIES: DUF3955 domain-containing protein [unclassified Bacillus (in: firmicutes)]MCU4760102.1 DUF3955 domain-containing protein [Bacillus cereus]MCU5109560.1 DUF3955 domain-containing protein [Bacillus cereus]MCU5342767.1 DUF3955 domain-containing protein [Bacillus cereus]MDF2018481.1 DUF3955 domain-containing protein [Bacillus sp. Cr_R3]MDF2032941.1 DUF3955 domain-containing protein [Bacillus sp. Cr_R16]